jgi:peptide/nickel transport system permease protein
MYWKYAAKRILYAVVMYSVIIFIFSCLFNTVAETVMRSQIQETMRAYAQGLSADRRLSGDQVKAMTDARREELYEQYRLNEPVLSRIVGRTVDTICFRFGDSTIIRSSAGETDVWTIVAEAIPRTLLVFLTAIVIDIVLGVALGLRKARKAGGVMDRATDIGTMVVFGLPAWWVGMMAIMVFAFMVPLFPSSGMHSAPPPSSSLGYILDLLWHMTLPVVVLVVLGFWGRAYLTRNVVLSTLQEDFIMSARARGLTERKILFGHTLRSAAPPIVTMTLLALLGSVTGSLLFEGIFSWPGMGNLYWVAVGLNDIPVLMGNLSVTTALFMIGLVILDLIYGLLDPRIKVSGRA